MEIIHRQKKITQLAERYAVIDEETWAEGSTNDLLELIDDIRMNGHKGFVEYSDEELDEELARTKQS